jgi:hypothetical protein
VPLGGQQSPYVVGAATRFHGHDAGGQLRRVRDHRLALHAPPQHAFAVSVQRDDTAAVLAKIDPENRDGHIPSPVAKPDRQSRAHRLG